MAMQCERGNGTAHQAKHRAMHVTPPYLLACLSSAAMSCWSSALVRDPAAVEPKVQLSSSETSSGTPGAFLAQGAHARTCTRSVGVQESAVRSSLYARACMWDGMRAASAKRPNGEPPWDGHYSLGAMAQLCVRPGQHCQHEH